MVNIMERDPCPDRIIDDAGGGFAMGVVGGSVFHFVKGLYNSPNGARFAGGMESMRMSAPRLAGSFAVWGGLFSACDCATVYVRQKEDPYNGIIAGAATGGILGIRQGFRAVVSGSLTGGVLLALITGGSIMVSNISDRYPASMPVDDPHMETSVPNTGSMTIDDTFVPHVEKSSDGGWFGGLFRKKVEGGATNNSNKTETLESFDVPSMPVPTFEYK